MGLAPGSRHEQPAVWRENLFSFLAAASLFAQNISLVNTTGRLQARKEGNGTSEVFLSPFDDKPLKSVLM
jgi:hypothetical protein